VTPPPSGPARLVGALLLAAAAIAAVAGGGYAVRELVAEMAAYAILAMALAFLVGQAGMVSLGHAAFFGLGAYAYAGLTVLAGVTPWAAWPLAVVAVAAFAVLVGLVAVRLAGVFFLMITLAFGEMAHAYFVRDRAFGGVGGLSGAPRPDLSWLAVSVADPAAFALFAVAVALLAWLVLDRLTLSGFGQALRAVHANEARAQALGGRIGLLKLGAFVVSASVAGLAGTVAAQRTGFVSPELLTWTLSGEALIMVIAGGAASLVGAAAAAALWVVLHHSLSAASDHWMLPMGLLFVALVLVAGDGLSGLARRLLGRLLGRRRGRAAPAL